MLVMTYSDARAHLSELLNRGKTDGAAIIKRADGSTFRVTVEESSATSPFDGIKSFANLPKDEILDIVRDSKRRKNFSRPNRWRSCRVNYGWLITINSKNAYNKI